MPHEISLITTIAAALGCALLFGLLASRLRLPPIVGYLVAGVVIGPGTPGFVADVGLARQLAEIGVMLLMFGVGLHLSLDDLLAVRRIAVPGALAQIGVATALGAALGRSWGWSWGAGSVFGLALSCASTVVLLRVLEDRGLLATLVGRISVGWLVVEDLVMVLVLVLLPAFGGLLASPGAGHPAPGSNLGLALALTLVKMAAFVALMWIGGRRLLPRLLYRVAGTGSRELFTLAVVATAVCVAFGAARLFDVSFALGAFLAGMMMRESEFSHRAADESLPLRDAFSVLFFVSVGMLVEPRVFLDQPLRVLAVVALVMVGNALVAALVVLVARYPLNAALTIGAGFAQIGEFSFILAALGVSLGVLPAAGQSLILAAALVSIALNSLVFAAVAPALAWIRRRSSLARRLEHRDDPLAELPATVDLARLAGQVVLVGYGRVGRRIAEALAEHAIPFVVAEQNRELVEQLRGRDIAAVSGDASDPLVLAQAHVARAGLLVIATPDTFATRKMIDFARRLNPGIEIVARTHSDDEAELLASQGGVRVFMGEHELALGMTRHVLERCTRTPR
jgi:CPA2 family monovalent cation:H+ antiporter-2